MRVPTYPPRVACLVVLTILCASSARAATVVYPPAGNHVHSSVCPVGDGWSHLTPDPVENAGEFFLLDGVSQEAQDELNDGDTDFTDWQIDNKTSFDFDTFGSAKGTFYIDIYKSVFWGNHKSGVDFHARYVGGEGEDNLQWVQYVTPEQPFDPDQLHDVNTGRPIPGRNGPIQPANGGFIDPWPNDGSDGGPFYWNSDEIGTYRKVVDGKTVLEFRDHPGDFHPPVSSAGMVFELYLVNWVDTEMPGHKTLEFLGGIQWGFHGECVPLPGSAWMGLALLAVVSIPKLRHRRTT